MLGYKLLYLDIKELLHTNICMQYVAMAPSKMIPTVPIIMPRRRTASGIASKPAPIQPLSKCIMVSPYLKHESEL